MGRPRYFNHDPVALSVGVKRALFVNLEDDQVIFLGVVIELEDFRDRGTSPIGTPGRRREPLAGLLRGNRGNLFRNFSANRRKGRLKLPRNRQPERHASGRFRL